MTYTNSCTTLEEIGEKHSLSKQRIWQIIRFCRLGKGSYYEGLKLYSETHRAYKNTHKDIDSKTLNCIMREWLKLNNIRVIKTKNDG